MERVALQGGIPPSSVLDTLDRTRVQFTPTGEREWAHVTDRERLIPVDGLRIDEGTAFGAAGTVDVEDYAVLCELDALRAAAHGRTPALERRYDVLVLDEAQELAPIELATLGRTLTHEGTLIVAGDAQQLTDETTAFPGWSEAMRELGRPDFETVELEIGYRCAPGIVSLARAVVGPRTGIRPLSQAIHGFDRERSLADWLTLGLRGLQQRDRRASVAVICRSPRTARRVADAFKSRDLPARLVYEGDFLPRGLQVTTVDQVKGLEFDFVVAPDVDARSYPDDPRSRNALYVTVTRARHEVVLAHVGERSPLVWFLGRPASST
jgi:DNA helicase IV